MGESSLSVSFAGKSVEELTAELTAGVKGIFDSDQYQEYLKAMSCFHDYSFNNTILILMQKPDASLVAGYSSWKKNFDRNVKKGEKAIKIIAPSSRKKTVETTKINPATNAPMLDTNGQPIKESREINTVSFRVVSVFDVSQTEGKEVPQLHVDLLTGDVQDFEKVKAVLVGLSPVPVKFEAIKTGANGYFSHDRKEIVIKQELSQVHTLKTLIHEITHAIFHNRTDGLKDVSRGGREIQAESVAFVVCSYYGIDTGGYSFPYVASWSQEKNTDELKSTMETIQQASSAIIMSVDRRMEEARSPQTRAFEIAETQKRIEVIESVAVPAIRKEAPAAAIIGMIAMNEVAQIARSIPAGTLKTELANLANSADTKEFSAGLQKISSGLKNGSFLTLQEKVQIAKDKAKERSR